MATKQELVAQIKGHDDTVLMAYLEMAALECLSDSAILGFGSCAGICQPQRPLRKHVDSTIIKPKQLT